MLKKIIKNKYKKNWQWINEEKYKYKTYMYGKYMENEYIYKIFCLLKPNRAENTWMQRIYAKLVDLRERYNFITNFR